MNKQTNDRIFELYNYLGLDVASIESDQANDYLTINKGRDGNMYAWYMDGTHDNAINIETGEIVDDEQTEELFA